MPGIRNRKSRRKSTIKITGAKRKKKIVQPSIGNKTLHEHWDKTKTLQQNMMDLGLSFDTNKTVKLPSRKRIKRKDIIRQNKLEAAGESMDVQKEEHVVNNAVVDEFEKQAANGAPGERHISPGEAKFVMELMHKHGTNFKKMARDKMNVYQHTSNQIKRKCEGLMRSSLLQKYKEMYPGLLPDDEMETES